MSNQRSRSPKRRNAVALLIETSNAYARGLLEGIAEYQRERDNWSVFLPEQERGATPPAWLSTWAGDGIIARIETAEIANCVSRLDVPVVDVSSSRRVSDIPWIETDDEAIAGLAFEHFFVRGFRHFAFCGPRGFNWATWRKDYFESKCRDNGFECHTFFTDSPYSRSNRKDRKSNGLAEWLSQVPKPIGLLCAYDIQAQVVLDTCRNIEISVPEQIAVIGVDNDPLVCDLCHPSLTSVAPDARRAGYCAAELLDQMMHTRHSTKASSKSKQTKHVAGDQVTRKRVAAKRGEAMAGSILMKPLGIVQRQSTDITAVTDMRVASAIRYIRDHACDGINVIDVLKHVHLSRRSLESLFLKATGTTPHAMIISVRMDRVRRLLQQSEASLDEIAHHAGFEHTEYMCVVFKKHFGVSPGRFRRQ